MGAWGAGSFENDDAMDWIGGLAPGSGVNDVRAALVPVTLADDHYVEAPDCSIAIAAAEAVAAARGRPMPSLPEEVSAWAKTETKLAPELVELARAAVDRIARKSELKDLWDESDSADAWRARISDLRKRLE